MMEPESLKSLLYLGKLKSNMLSVSGKTDWGENGMTEVLTILEAGRLG